VRIDLGALRRLSGFVGAAVVDSETGLVLGRIAADGRDLDTAAAGGMELVRAARRMAHALGTEDDVEEVLVSLAGQYHLARTVARNPAIFLYLWLDRSSANLALARITLKQVETAIAV
jgi:predicted regulator of Ras-like GTPase activity (Roadblock/LC7/MglB family)